MEQRRYHTDPATGEFLLMERGDDCWHPSMPTMEKWQRGDTRIYRPLDRPNTLVTMPYHIYWTLLTADEHPNIRVLLGRPWIQNSQAQDIPQDDLIDVIDAVTTGYLSIGHLDMHDILVPVPTPELQPFPKHLIDAVLEHAETTNKSCPITMDPIQKATATVTICGHIFQKAALTEWLKTNTTCPECRAPCI